jgi:RHS repeat-associated protein
LEAGHDLKGSAVAVTDDPENPANVIVVERFTYSAYGKATAWWGPDWGLDESYSGGSGLSKFGLPYLYTGQRFDVESGLHYFKNRVYDPQSGRFLRRDLIGYGSERRRSPPREGPALLQGLVICGKCGDRMTVRYHYHHGKPIPEYTCQRKGIASARPRCQTIHGAALDEAIGSLLLEIVTPLTLEVALTVERELRVRAEEADRLRRQHVERARYEAELARRRYMQVDPDNRLVADQLEHEWNDRLRAVQAVREEYDRQRERDRTALDDEKRRRIMSLATDFPRLWKDPATTARDRKRMVRLIIEDVTLIKGDRLDAHVRFRGGSTKSLSLPLPLSAWQLRQTSRDVVAEVDRLLDHHTPGEIAEILNRRGLKSGEGKTFHRHIVTRIQQAYGLRTRHRRLREAGMLALHEMAKALGVSEHTVKVWRRCGLLEAQPYNDKKQYLYRPPADDGPRKHTRKGLSEKQRQRRLRPHQTNEVQCET